MVNPRVSCSRKPGGPDSLDLDLGPTAPVFSAIETLSTTNAPKQSRPRDLYRSHGTKPFSRADMRWRASSRAMAFASVIQLNMT